MATYNLLERLQYDKRNAVDENKIILANVISKIIGFVLNSQTQTIERIKTFIDLEIQDLEERLDLADKMHEDYQIVYNKLDFEIKEFQRYKETLESSKNIE